MNPPDTEHDPQAMPAAPTQCDECGAPVDAEQRYCVVCGAHRRHVEDPAARYLSGLTAKARIAQSATVARPVRRAPARGRGLGVAVALALVPVAAAVGVVAARSSNNGDAKLERALVREQQAVLAASTATTSGASAGTGGAAASADASSATHSGHSRRVRHTGARHHAHKASSTSSIPGGTAISTNPPTQAQKNAGAQATQKVQKSKGKSYVNGQKSLPGTVVVP